MILSVTPYLPTPGIILTKEYAACLRMKALPVQCYADVADLVKNMRETVIQLGALGLAATQVGSLQRVVVALVEGRITTMINPVITKTEGTQRSKEGCLSLTGATAIIDRPYVISVQYSTPEQGELVNITEVFKGSDAATVCHELDHLDGVLLVDKLKGMNKKVFMKKLAKHTRMLRNYMKHNKIQLKVSR